jgi:replication factor A1
LNAGTDQSEDVNTEDETTKVDSVTEEVLEQIDTDQYDLPPESEVRSKVSQFFEKMSTLGEDQCVTSTLRHFARQEDASLQEYTGSSGSGLTEVEPGNNPWYNGLVVKVVDLYTPDDSEYVRQRGTFDDGETSMDFVVWKKGTDEIGLFEEGKVYKLDSVVAEVNDRSQETELYLNKQSSFEELDQEIEESGDADDSGELTGVIVGQRSSGLVHRAVDGEEEGNVVSQSEYDGEVEPDLRLMLYIDNGEECVQAIFDKELTEEITGFTLDEAVEMAKDAMDTSVVIRDMMQDLFGRYIRVEGLDLNYFIVNEYEFLEGSEPETDLGELQLRLRSLEGGDN